MNVLLTGASSFTGFWFAKALKARGFAVTATLQREPAAYDGVRAARVAGLAEVAEIVPNVSFGDARFLDLVGSRDFDVLAHHAARVTDYKSLDFDVPTALAENTRALRPVLERMAGRGLRAIIATSSVFEADVGEGEMPREAFSPYGLSKTLSYHVLRFWAQQARIPMGRFIIPNPFGPFEDPRFCAYLMKCWGKGETASVSTPAYERDNIHVDLLALAYAGHVQDVASKGAGATLGPRGYVETQGAFAERFAAAMRARTGLPCVLNLADQKEFPEPRRRVNTDATPTAALGWHEAKAWDAVAAYYKSIGTI